MPVGINPDIVDDGNNKVKRFDTGVADEQGSGLDFELLMEGTITSKPPAVLPNTNIPHCPFLLFRKADIA